MGLDPALLPAPRAGDVSVQLPRLVPGSAPGSAYSAPRNPGSAEIRAKIGDNRKRIALPDARAIRLHHEQVAFPVHGVVRGRELVAVRRPRRPERFQAVVG
jgi:hypothetical protein